ncbi:MAG: methylenetetrahydrofolate reductase [Pseudomonadota bacterium]
MQLSYEFFPPRGEGGFASVRRVCERLAEFQPDFCSVTYGAGGSTRDGTRDTVSQLTRTGMDVAPHLSIGNDDEDTIGTMLDGYRDQGVTRLVALRGDVSSGVGAQRIRHNAETLVHWIRARSDAANFHVTVAAYPEVHPDATSPASDLEYFRKKVEAGADSAITQYFYNAACYADFLDRAASAGISMPIYPGIMPITNYEGILRFSRNCGADVPRWIEKRLEAYKDDEPSLKAFGIEVVTTLCEDLLRLGAPGLHFYTLNRWGATSTVCRNLGLNQRIHQTGS